MLPKAGQQGFLDLSKPQDPIELEENFEDNNECEPSEPPGDDQAKPSKEDEDEMIKTYQDECTSSGDESREVREMRRIERSEKRKKETEETTEAADEQIGQKVFAGPRRSRRVPARRGERGKRHVKIPKPNRMLDNELLLDDAPESIRGAIRRMIDEKGAEGSDGSEVTLTPEEEETMCVAFLAERFDTYTKRNKQTELHPQKMKSQLLQFTDKEIEEAIQKVVEKEIGTWQRFDAIDIVPPDESQEIREASPEKVISSSRGVWTKKGDEKRDENEKEDFF